MVVFAPSEEKSPGYEIRRYAPRADSWSALARGLRALGDAHSVIVTTGGWTMNTRARIASAVLTTQALVVAGVATTAMPAHAEVASVYAITSVGRAWFYGDKANPASCTWSGASPLTLDLKATVANPVFDGQVNVSGLTATISSGGVDLGTVNVADAALEPGVPGGSWAVISCKAWRSLMVRGFGGPATNYHITLHGPGTTTDTNDGSPAGSVETSDSAYQVTVRQLAKFTASGKRILRTIRLRTGWTAWAKKSGRYTWTPLKHHRITLQKLSKAGTSWQTISRTVTNLRGKAVFKLAATRRGSYVRFRTAGYSYGYQTMFFVDRQGHVSPAGR